MAFGQRGLESSDTLAMGELNAFDDLPMRDRNHAVEEMVETKFRTRLSKASSSSCRAWTSKAGADCQIEVVEGGRSSPRTRGALPVQAHHHAKSEPTFWSAQTRLET